MLSGAKVISTGLEAQFVGGGYFIGTFAGLRNENGEPQGDVPLSVQKVLQSGTVDGVIIFQRGTSLEPKPHRMTVDTDVFVSQAIVSSEQQKRDLWRWLSSKGIPPDNLQLIPSDLGEADHWIGEAIRHRQGGREVVMIVDEASYGDLVAKSFGEKGLYANLGITVAVLPKKVISGASIQQIFAFLTNMNLWHHVLRMDVAASLEEQGQTIVTYAFQA